MVGKRLELKQLLQTLCGDIKNDYPGTELTYEGLDKARSI